MDDDRVKFHVRRLMRVGEACAGTERALESARRRRNAKLLEAVDEGLSKSAAGRAAGVTEGYVRQLIQEEKQRAT